jgi:hypothetical protein
MRMSLFLHFGSVSTFERRPTVDDGLERPDSNELVELGDEDRGDEEYTLRLPNSLYSAFRFTHVPPKSNVTTTSGSIKAPAPMVDDKENQSALPELVGKLRSLKGEEAKDTERILLTTRT